MSFLSAADADKNSYDVVVVGSGAAGGQTAYTLAMEGARVLMLEAGRRYEPATETPMMQVNGDAPLRGAGTPEKPFGFWDATIDGGWQVPGEPYTSASDDPARQFVWWRARMLGGRTNHWGRISLRNGPYDFKPHSRDGLGFDWPMTYEDLAPYYDKVEMLIGVYGSNDGLENTPNSSPGVLLPPPKPRVSDLLIQQRARKLGIPAIAACPNYCIPATPRRRAFWPPTCRSERRASSPRHAGEGARFGLTTSPRRCTCRRRWTPAISTSSPTPWSAR